MARDTATPSVGSAELKTRSFDQRYRTNVPWNTQHKKFVSVLIVTISLFLPLARAQVQEPDLSRLGVYGKTSTYCGAKAIPQNEPTIPQVGCFYLSAQHRATGRFATHRVEVSVDQAGMAVFEVDGTRIIDTHDTATWTNLPYVSAGGVAGYSFCEGPTDRRSGCPSSITIFANRGNGILFVVSKCLPPSYHVCVTTQENWDYENSRRQ
jgi:hypothetical protein